MKKMIYLENEYGGLVALADKCTTTKEGYGYIIIQDKAIEKAKNLGIISKPIEGTGYYNKYYIMNPYGFRGNYLKTVLYPNNVALVCCDLYRSGYKAYQIMDGSVPQIDALAKYKVGLNNTKGKKFEPGRHICVASSGGKVILPNGEIKGKVEAPLIAALSRGLIYEKDMEVHHINAHWDMRMGSIECLIAEEHYEQNSKNHRLDAVVNNVSQLMALVNYVNTPHYFNQFR